jgi:hypothetical protein
VKIIFKILLTLIITLTTKIYPEYVYKPPKYNIFPPHLKNDFPDAILLAESHRILLNLQSSTYQADISVTETTGEYKVDSSQLANYILKYTLNDHFDVLGQARPYSEDYYTYFNTCLTTTSPTYNKGWMQIAYLRNGKPGDIIALKKSGAGGDDGTGSTFIIQVWPPRNTRIGPISIDGTDHWGYNVTVMDSTVTDSYHNQDTRNNTKYPEYPATQGIGTGNMYFYVDINGEIKYHAWSDDDSIVGGAGYDYAIGRAVPFPE